MGEQIDSVIGAFETLARMPLLHAQHSILQKSLLTKMTYLQRTLATGAPFSQVAAHGRRYDAALRRLVQGFVPHTRLHDKAWRIATFPTSLGGLGYRTFAEVADPAFLASYAHARTTLPAFFPWLTDALADPPRLAAAVARVDARRCGRRGCAPPACPPGR